MKKTVLALALLSLSTHSYAEPSVYGGLSVGTSGGDYSSSTTYGFFVGSTIMPMLDIEAGYVNHGTRGSVQTSDQITPFSLYVGIRPVLDLGLVRVYGKLGAHSYGTSGSNDYESELNDSGFNSMYGFGAEYFIYNAFAIGAGYQGYTLNSGSIQSLFVTASYQFQ